MKSTGVVRKVDELGRIVLPAELRHSMDIHIKDALEDGSVVPAGNGIGRVADLLAAYHAAGGRVVTLEPHLMVFDGLKALEREGEETHINPYVYETNDQAFDAASNALRALL